MGSSFQQSVRAWYEITISDQDAAGVFLPLASMRSLADEEAWGPTQWMYFMQGLAVTEGMRLAILELCHRVAHRFQPGPASRTLPWLLLWESLHHTRAEYSKRTGCDEYSLITKFDFVPRHTAADFQAWAPWFAEVARENVNACLTLDALVPFMAYAPWLAAIATSCERACTEIEEAIARTSGDAEPSVFYAQHQWVVWCLRHRHPNETYDTKSLMHRLFSERSLIQLACFWHDGEKGHPDGLLPEDIPKIWQRPLFAGSDITDAETPEWQQAWVDVISTPNWARRLSFWVAMVRVRRQGTTPPWLAIVIRDHPAEWKFFETMHSWMSQMPPYIEPELTSQNMDTFRIDCLDYEYKLARALWVMYNSEETVEEIPLPSMDD